MVPLLEAQPAAVGAGAATTSGAAAAAKTATATATTSTDGSSVNGNGSSKGPHFVYSDAHVDILPSTCRSLLHGISYVALQHAALNRRARSQHIDVLRLNF